MRSGAAETQAAAAYPYAGLVSRLTALGVDVVLLTVSCLAISILPTLAWQEVIGRSPGWLSVTSGILAGILPLAYFSGCWWLSGQTAGGLLVGLVVRRPNGRDLSLPRAVLRALVGLALAPVWLVGMLGVLWDPRRRAWHDVLFGTVVRHTAPLGRMATGDPDAPHDAMTSTAAR